MTTNGGYRRGRHLVLVMKYRRDVLDSGMLRCYENAVWKVCADSGAELGEFTGQNDHVHLLAAHPPKVSGPALVNSLKGVPPRRPRARFPGQMNRHVIHGAILLPVLPRRIQRRRAAVHREAVNRQAGLTLP
jgi:REP element-mobilizing transposase RayT